MTQWIKCSERMPEPLKWVICWQPGMPEPQEDALASDDDPEWTYTHWMPLPEPPTD